MKKKKKITIGVNLIRPSIYKDYGNSLSSEGLVTFYNMLLRELMNRGYSYELFSDGMQEDYELVNKLEKDVSRTPFVPHTVSEFLHTISSYDLVIGFRLHACISSVALDVPVIGMIWDSKSKYFAKTMGLEHFFIGPEQLEIEYVLNLMQERLQTPVDYSSKNDLKTRCKLAIADFLKKYS